MKEHWEDFARREQERKRQAATDKAYREAIAKRQKEQQQKSGKR